MISLELAMDRGKRGVPSVLSVVVVFLCVLAFIDRGQAIENPCQHYTEINDDRRSTAFTLANGTNGLCDTGLVTKWYRFTSAAGGMLPEHCVQRHQCGTVMPIWLNGSHPSEGEGTVVMTVCANMHGSGSHSTAANRCCESSANIGVRNCGRFYVYLLPPSKLCYSAYCAGDKFACPVGKNSSTGYSPCVDAYPPEFLDAKPTLSGPEVRGHSFRFNCDVNFNGSHNPNLTYEIQWLFDGQVDTNIPNMYATPSNPSAFLSGLALKGHLPSDVGCRVRAWYRTRTNDNKSPWRNSNTYWAGVTVTPKVEVTEKGENRTVTVTSTVPIMCDFAQDTACCLHLSVDIDGPKANAVVPHPCTYPLCKLDWDPNTKNASTNITIVATKDQIRDGDQHLELSFEKLQTGGGGPYLDVFSGFQLPSTQITVKDEATHLCSFVTDPHFRTFNNRIYDMFGLGDFTIYENRMDTFEVQARTYRCGHPATCTCAVAIREHNDVIRINACQRRHGAPTVEVASQPLRDGTAIHRSPDGRHIMVYLPSGREVRVDALRYCLNTYVSVPGSDKNRGRGLCGTLDGQIDTDMTHRNGYVERRRDCRTHHPHCMPGDFIESWRNHRDTSLFETIPNDLNEHKEDPKFCQCDTSQQGSPRINCTSNADVVHRAQQCGAHNCPEVTPQVPSLLSAIGQWTRRSVTYQDLDHPDPPVPFHDDPMPDTPTPMSWPTPSGITQQQAETTCREALHGSQLSAHCSQHTPAFKSSFSSCVIDVLIMDSVQEIDSAVSSFTAACQFSLRQDPNNYHNSTSGGLVLQAQFSEVCSTTCLRHGRCVQGQCVCEAGFTGDSCQLVDGPPTLDRVRGSALCDRNQRPCRAIYIDADNFENSDNLKCRVHTIQPDGTMSGTATESKASFIAEDRLACHLPDTQGRSKTNFSVSVTCDGGSYSNALHVLVFDSSCLDCTDTGCVKKKNTCLIKDQCYQNGNLNTDDATKICNTSASTTMWTTIAALGSYPSVDRPSLSELNADFLFTCTIPDASNDPNVRFRVTWYNGNDVLTGSQETLTGSESKASISLFTLPAGNVDLRCAVSSFRVGSVAYSPEVFSNVVSHQVLHN